MDIQQEIRLHNLDKAVSAAALRKSQFFNEVPDEELLALVASRNSAWRVVRRHGLIMNPTDVDGSIYLIAEGNVGMGAPSFAGREFIGTLLLVEDVFSAADLPPELGEVTHARAMSDQVVVFRFDHEEYLRLRVRYPSMRDRVELQTVRCFHELGQTTLDFAFNDVRGRFERILGHFALRYENHIVPFTHEELGWFTALKKNRVTTLLTGLHDQGLAHTVTDGPKHGVHVPDPQTLLDPRARTRNRVQK